MAGFSIEAIASQRDAGTASHPVWLANAGLSVPAGSAIYVEALAPAFLWVTGARAAYDVDGAAALAPGHYSSIDDVCAALQTALGGTYTATFDSVANRVTIANTVDLVLTVTAGDLLNTVLGYAAGEHSGAATYTAANPPAIYPLMAVLNVAGLGAGLEHGTDRQRPALIDWPQDAVASAFLRAPAAYNEIASGDRPHGVARVEIPIREFGAWWSLADGTALDVDGADWWIRIRVFS